MACRVDLELLLALPRKNLADLLLKTNRSGALTRSACLVNLKETVGPWGGLPTPGLLLPGFAPLTLSPVLPQPPHPSPAVRSRLPMDVGRGLSSKTLSMGKGLSHTARHQATADVQRHSQALQSLEGRATQFWIGVFINILNF